MSKKKWGKTAVKTERIVRDAVPKPEVLVELDRYLTKARSVTEYELANKFGIRLSLARHILRSKANEGLIVPYLHEGGLVAYTTPAEMQADRQERRIRISEVLEEVASSAASSSVITEEMELALAEAAASIESIKPSKLARQRREAGARKEKARDRRPEVIVEPLEGESAQPVPPPQVEAPKSTMSKHVSTDVGTTTSSSSKTVTTEEKPAETKSTRRTTKKSDAVSTEEKPAETKSTRRTTKKSDATESTE